jgi:hypothetical protein
MSAIEACKETSPLLFAATLLDQLRQVGTDLQEEGILFPAFVSELRTAAVKAVRAAALTTDDYDRVLERIALVIEAGFRSPGELARDAGLLRQIADMPTGNTVDIEVESGFRPTVLTLEWKGAA